jgi:hypothetical protein
MKKLSPFIVALVPVVLIVVGVVPYTVELSSTGPAYEILYQNHKPIMDCKDSAPELTRFCNSLLNLFLGMTNTESYETGRKDELVHLLRSHGIKP